MKPINLELFSCAGGMAEGFRRAGIHFDMAVDMAKDHVISYQTNLGEKPVCMDARDLLRMVKLGWRVPIDLLVADPPCTPWSRAGKRRGTADERDMLEETCELISILRPRRYLIGNVPGLDDQPNWHIVQRVIGGLSRFGYCVADFAALDAADFGVAQRRIRPFWFGHQEGPCIRWTEPTHSDPDLLSDNLVLPGVDMVERRPWVTCKQALGHLPPKDLGRPIRLRKRKQNGKQHGSVKEKPARGVGTSNLSDGNVLLTEPHHPPSFIDEPAMTVRAGSGGGSNRALQLSPRAEAKREWENPHPPSQSDAPARTITTSGSRAGDATTLEIIGDDTKHPVNQLDQPAFTVVGSDGGGGKRVLELGPPSKKRRGPSGKISGGRDHAQFAGGYTPSTLDEPAKTVVRNTHGDGTVLVLNEKHPPASPNSPAPTIGAKSRGQQGGECMLTGEPAKKRKKRTPGLPGSTPMGHRVGDPERPAATLCTTSASRQGGGAATTVAWPWDRPATTVQGDERIPPPGHHDEHYSIMTMTGAVLLSEKAATILQGFPESWVFHGKSKKIRWSQLGQAMPPPLAHAVALAIVDQERRTYEARADAQIVLSYAPITQRW